jgi:hypothetical protein
MYQVTLQMIKREMATAGNAVSLDDVKRDIRQIYSQSQYSKGNVHSYDMNQKETALLPMQPQGRGAKKTLPKKVIVAYVARKVIKLLTAGRILTMERSQY